MPEVLPSQIAGLGGLFYLERPPAEALVLALAHPGRRVRLHARRPVRDGRERDVAGHHPPRLYTVFVDEPLGLAELEARLGVNGPGLLRFEPELGPSVRRVHF